MTKILDYHSVSIYSYSIDELNESTGWLDDSIINFGIEFFKNYK